MVSFTSISNGMKLCVLVSSFIYTVSAAPATKAVSTNSVTFTLPPIISGRAQIPKSRLSPNMNIEKGNIAKNNAWTKANNGTISTVSKLKSSQVAGLFLDLPSIYPPITAVHDRNTKTSTASQVRTLKKYADLAATAYCRTVVPAGSWNCAHCRSSVPDGVLVTTFTSLLDDTNGFILRSKKDKTLYLVFRGTNSIRNAIVDIQIVLTNYPNVAGAKVHTGFLKSYNSVVSDFFPVLQKQIAAHPSYKVIVVGHSLGGAQALLAAMDLYTRDFRLGPKNLSIYTYGAPRLGNTNFAHFVDGTGIPLSRTVHKRDIVPHLPPMAFGFLHPGVESWITDDPATVKICKPDVEISECSDSIVPFTSITDHFTYFNINQGLCL